MSRRLKCNLFIFHSQLGHLKTFPFPFSFSGNLELTCKWQLVFGLKVSLALINLSHNLHGKTINQRYVVVAMLLLPLVNLEMQPAT